MDIDMDMDVDRKNVRLDDALQTDASGAYRDGLQTWLDRVVERVERRRQDAELGELPQIEALVKTCLISKDAVAAIWSLYHGR